MTVETDDLKSAAGGSFNNWEEKINAAAHTSNDDIADFTFTTLTIGETYRVSSNIQVLTDSADPSMSVKIRDASAGGGNILSSHALPSKGVTDNQTSFISFVFTATTASLYWNCESMSGTTQVNGNGTNAQSFVTVSEAKELGAKGTI